MIARADGQVVLVSGAIPGERVTARVERLGKGVVYASTTEVREPSADRRAPVTDCACGGLLYAHIAYPRQLEIKAAVIADAFGRIGRLPLAAPVAVAGSPEDGYRMRARLHVRDGRWGFFREGTHTLCDARATRQLLPATCDAVDDVVTRLAVLGAADVREIELSENVDASERAMHLEGGEAATVASDPALARALGPPTVTDRLSIRGHEVALDRHVLSFFQGNRYLLGRLVTHVVDALGSGATAIDLYAGVGLFAVSAAACKGLRVTAVEGDRVSAEDLRANGLREGSGRVRAVHEAVEAFVAASRERPDVVIVDPPRTGMSREALDGAMRLRSPRVVYVSCDVATLARDARRLVDAGYAMTAVDGFDLFPNTPHVETVAVFER
jgi:23S rRNA (uracil1939-C5)-methyltransferase